MNIFRRLLGSLLIGGMALALPAGSGAESLGTMRVSASHGDVLVRIAETGEWAPVSANMPLVEGDELWVPQDGRAALQTNHGDHVRLDEGTALQVLRMDGDSFQFHLVQGYAYVLGVAPRRSVLQFDTPDASVRAFGSSTFRVDVLDLETYVSVFQGSVLAESDAGTTRVRAGEMLALGPRGYAELSPLPPPDEWERWNGRQDRIVLARGSSRRYLPAELDVYAADFDRNGRWVSVRGYGYCWTPTVVVIDDWAPYRHGRWVWRGGHYVWIGYEPWGWAPYHYGRWTFVRRVGWCWVPPAGGEVFWGPGYVGWVQTPEYVAWVPLAPGEVYYGYGHYGPHSVNITNVNIDEIRVTKVYRNVKVVNSVTVVHHATFVSGEPAPVDRRVAGKIREHFVERRNIVPGRPRIRPVEASYLPVVRPVPERKRPPESVRAIDARKVRQSRPLVREPERSTLRPEERSRPLEPRKVETPKSVNERIRDRGRERPEEDRDRGGGPRPRLEREIEGRRPPESRDRDEGAEAPARRERPGPSRTAPEREAERKGADERPREAQPARSEERKDGRSVEPRQAPPGDQAGTEGPRRKDSKTDGGPRGRAADDNNAVESDAADSKGGDGGGKADRSPRPRDRRDGR